MPKFVHIDIAADDPERSAAFFTKVFGWQTTKLEGPTPYWLISTDPNDKAAIGAGIARREHSWQSVSPTIAVSSADEYARRIEAAGGKIVVPKTAIPGVGQLISFEDPDGNVFAILEPAEGNPFAGG